MMSAACAQGRVHNATCLVLPLSVGTDVGIGVRGCRRLAPDVCEMSPRNVGKHQKENDTYIYIYILYI